MNAHQCDEWSQYFFDGFAWCEAAQGALNPLQQSCSIGEILWMRFRHLRALTTFRHSTWSFCWRIHCNRVLNILSHQHRMDVVKWKELWPLALFRSQKVQWCPVEVQKKRQIMDHLTWWMVFNIHNAISWRCGALLLHLSDISCDLWKWGIYTDVVCKIARRFCQVIGWDYSCATISNQSMVNGWMHPHFFLSVKMLTKPMFEVFIQMGYLWIWNGSHHCWSWLAC